ncbi:MAG TPA: GtrA family protein [Nocardioides sp.]
MTSRARRLAGEVWRYLAVGLGATIVAVLLFNLLVHGYSTTDWAPLNGHPLQAYVIANLVGMAISYRGTRSWAFRHRDTAHPDGGRTAWLVINVATMTIPVGCLWVSRSLLGLDDPFSDNVSANVVGLALANASRFFLSRQFIFSVRTEQYDGERARPDTVA